MMQYCGKTIMAELVNDRHNMYQHGFIFLVRDNNGNRFYFKQQDISDWVDQLESIF